MAYNEARLYLFQIFRSFLPLRNPIGFGASDFVVFVIALLFATLLVFTKWTLPYLRTHVSRSRVWVSLLFAVAVISRLILLPRLSMPLPSSAADFSRLLLADTLSHLRLANATHPLPQFFTAPLVVLQPSYGSVLPWGQGLALAIGQLLFHTPWAGMLMLSAFFSAICYWMLRSLLPPMWAILGGVFALVVFGPLGSWTNSYSASLITATAGCLLLGSLLRLRHTNVRYLRVIAGGGLALLISVQPRAGVLLTTAVALCFFRTARRSGWSSAILPVATAVVLSLGQSKLMTGAWFGLQEWSRINLLLLFLPLILLCAIWLLMKAGSRTATFIAIPCAAFFVFWYGVILFGGDSPLPVTQYQHLYNLNLRNASRQATLQHSLDQLPGNQLVFVHPSAFQYTDYWVHNRADIDSAKVVWANDLGSDNQKLLGYYLDRTAWLVNQDAQIQVLVPVH